MKEEITNYPSKEKPWLKYYDYDTEKGRLWRSKQKYL